MILDRSIIFGLLSMAISNTAIGGQTVSTLSDRSLTANVCRDLSSVESSTQDIAMTLAEAISDAHRELAASLAVEEFCRVMDKPHASDVEDYLAANAIELLLDAGQTATAIALMSTQEARLNRDFKGATRSHLRLQSAQARLLSFRDRNVEALEMRLNMQEAINLVCGALSSEAIENRIRAANLRIELGQVSDGLRELTGLAVLASSHLLDDERLLILVLRSKAIAWALTGDSKIAIQELNHLRSDLVSKFGTDDRRVIDVDEDLASVLLRSDEIEGAVTQESRVFVWRSSHLAPGNPEVRRALWLLGYLYVVNQRPETARAIFEYLLDATSSDYEFTPSRFYLQTLSRIASIDARSGNFPSAVEKWQFVYENARKILGDASVETQVEETNYAAALLHIGQVGMACKLLTDTLQRESETRPKDTWAIEFTRISLARCWLRSADPAQIAKAREALEQSLSEMLQDSDEAGPHTLVALATLARASLIAGDRKQAKAMLEDLVSRTEKSRLTFPQGFLFRDSAFTGWVEGKTPTGEDVLGYRDLALMHAQDAELESALRISELARDRSLGDLFADAEWRRTRLPAGERGRLDAVIDRIQDFDERLAISGDIVDRVRLEAERTLAVAERGRVERELRGRLHLDEAAPRPPTLDDLREHLPAGTALVSVLHSGETWWALVIARGLPARFVPLADPDLGVAASAWVRRLRGEPVRAWPVAGDRLSISDVRPGGATGAYLSEAALGRRLAHGLFLPLARAAAPARRLVFVGDDELVGIPLQALPDGAGLVLDRYAISYAPSLSTYARWLAPARQRTYARDLLAVGAVDDPPFAAPETDDPIVAGVQFAADHPLPFARQEIDGIVALFDGRRATAWTGKDANKTALRQASRSGALLDYRFVHFATHAWAQADQPESSAIVLAGASGDLPTQRALTAAELAGLHMGSDLIVLSACDTGVGPFEHGRGLLGLAYAGLAAGNRAELVSLWPVADDTTARFMQDLYRRLRAGTEPVQAVAAAQRTLRRSADPRRSDPRAWAPFVLYGAY